MSNGDNPKMLKWALGIILMVMISGGGFILGAWSKPDEKRGKELITREINYPWTNDRPVVMERLRTSDIKVTEIAIEQKIQGKQITDIDKNVGIILHELKK